MSRVFTGRPALLMRPYRLHRSTSPQRHTSVRNQPRMTHPPLPTLGLRIPRPPARYHSLNTPAVPKQVDVHPSLLAQPPSSYLTATLTAAASPITRTHEHGQSAKSCTLPSPRHPHAAEATLIAPRTSAVCLPSLVFGEEAVAAAAASARRSEVATSWRASRGMGTWWAGKRCGLESFM